MTLLNLFLSPFLFMSKAQVNQAGNETCVIYHDSEITLFSPPFSVNKYLSKNKYSIIVDKQTHNTW